MLMATKILITPSSISLTHSCSRKFTTLAAGDSGTRIIRHPPDLIRWVRHKGGLVHKSLKIADGDSTGFGLIASSEIPSGSELIALPNNLPICFSTIDPENDQADATLLHIARSIPEELWAMKLGLKLLHERMSVDSFWWSYVNNLPAAFNHPIFFSGEDITALQYVPLIQQVKKRCRFLLDFEREIKCVLDDAGPQSHPFGCNDVNSSLLGWAMSAVSSRAFRLHGSKAEDGTMPMLLPVIDMCNHSFNPNALIVQERDAHNPKMFVKVIAETQIDQGAPVTLNYGPLSNDLLLLDYGFVIPGNPYDRVELKFDRALLEAAIMATGVERAERPDFSAIPMWQEHILSRLNLLGPDADLKVTLGGPELVDGRLLAALRVLVVSDVETAKRYCDLDTLQSLSAEAPLSLSNEISTLRSIIALCVILHEYFPTNMMQDQSALEGDYSTTRKLAIQFRMGKKSVIMDVMRDLTRRVKMLSQEKIVSPI